jgi:hypothetical protein
MQGNNPLKGIFFSYHLPLRVLTPSGSPVIGGEQPPGRRRIKNAITSTFFISFSFFLSPLEHFSLFFLSPYNKIINFVPNNIEYF